MMDLKRGVLFVSVFCLGIGCVVARADDKEKEKEVSLDKVPAAARTAIETWAAGGKIEEVCQETEEGQTVYEAEVERDGGEYEITVSAEGQVLETETEMALEDLPVGVRTTLESFARVGKLEEIVKEEKGGKETYEAEAKMRGAELELSLSPAGVVVEVKAESRHKDRDKAEDEEAEGKKGEKDDED